MTFGSCLEDCDDLGWFGIFPTVGTLIASLVAFKDSNITAIFFFWVGGSKLLTLGKK